MPRGKREILKWGPHKNTGFRRTKLGSNLGYRTYDTNYEFFIFSVLSLTVKYPTVSFHFLFKLTFTVSVGKVAIAQSVQRLGYRLEDPRFE
jgi:hypothetical protein